MKNYDYVGEFVDGVAIVKYRNKWGVINEKGKEICKPKYEKMAEFFGGYAKVVYKGKAGFVNSLGYEICEPKFDAAWNFNLSGFATVLMGSKYYYLNGKGEIVKEL